MCNKHRNTNENGSERRKVIFPPKLVLGVDLIFMLLNMLAFAVRERFS